VVSIVLRLLADQGQGATHITIPQHSSLLRTHALKLPHPLNSLQPPHPALDKLLSLRPQLRLMQLQIIHSPNPTETQPGKPTAAAIHQSATDGAETASHRVACADGLAGGVGCELVLAADVDES
jgi:hypothetical protein